MSSGIPHAAAARPPVSAHPASLADIVRLRVQGHGLADMSGASALTSPLAVVERLLAVQAQDFAASKWALGVRSPGTTAADVDAAVTRGLIVRSWPMRGTLHLVPATELHWMLRLSTARLVTGAKTRHAQLELTTQILERAREIALEALGGGRSATRAEFLALLDSRGINTTQQRGYHTIWFLAQTGTLCWGPLAGNQQALVLLDEWVPNPRELEHDEALGEFALRYFAGHGPATLADFAGWSQLTLTQARIGLAVARPHLTELFETGTSPDAAPLFFVDTGADAGGPPRQRSSVLALPGFDEYLIGYRDRTALISDVNFLRVVPGKNGIYLPLLVSGGRVVGTWRKNASARAVTVSPQPFGTLTVRQQAGLRRGIRDYGRFLGLGATLLDPEPGLA
ncbi:winged helix DNA-binding domain-containing protein [Cryobacterium melibiosiphilum]|uniref:Winged helix DNA-binding domain-containing protein n=1 Tax=Cryobacterium melibiosiphilum TaxID=995039 RepID=A0A3A5MJT4_9MICO|nr:winged helix DNA-binding domain-containing protein [Cryobacterium melibiosiphilum]RJT89171.1 winged helix DNA-binding domain-containing protein [Cryobacterium melibiosiphilum]